MPSISLACFRQEVLALYAPPLRARRTHAKMGRVLAEVGALPGVRAVADLTAPTVARYVAARAARGVAANTIRGDLGYLSAALGYALHRGWLRHSPFGYRALGDWVRPEPPADPRHHSRAEIAAVLDRLQAGAAASWEAHRLWALAATVAYTGLRRDEALYLQVRDVRPTAGLLDIVARRRRGTRAAAAPVPIPPPLAAILAGWYPESGPVWLFPNRRRSGPWTGGSVTDRPLGRLAAAARAAGVAGMTFRSLRHSFATHAEAWGLSELMLQRVLRHTTARTQLVYRHADEANLRAAVQRVTFAEAG